MGMECGGEEDPVIPLEEMDSTPRVESSDAAPPADEPILALDTTLCDTLYDRVMSCGWLYTFETFAEDCAAWASDGDWIRISALEECAPKTCQPLLGCIEDVYE
jgi:hypothetical protein